MSAESKNTAKPHAISASDYLRAEHKKIRGLCRQFEGMSSRDNEMEEGVIREFFMEAETHLAVEEELLYPLLKESSDATARMLAEESVADHGSIARQIADLRAGFLRALASGGMITESYEEKIKDLIEEFDSHLMREETEVLPIAERLLGLVPGKQSEQLALRFKERKAELLAFGMYRPDQASVVQNPHGGEQKRRPA